MHTKCEPMTDAREAKRMSAEELASLSLAWMVAERARIDLEDDFPAGADARAKFRDARKTLADAAPNLLAHIAALEASPALFSDYGKGYVEERCALEVAAERERCGKIADHEAAIFNKIGEPGHAEIAEDIAAAIRRRDE